jgi:predicted DNA-binding protein
MSRPTTIRVPEELLREISDRAKRRGTDRASYLRELLRKGLAADVEQEVEDLYTKGGLSFSEAGRRLGLDPYELLDWLRRRNLSLNVSLEDWIDSRPAL